MRLILSNLKTKFLLDFDECSEFEFNDCNPINSLCKNTLGSYKCECLKGFIKLIYRLLSVLSSMNATLIYMIATQYPPVIIPLVLIAVNVIMVFMVMEKYAEVSSA